jgi:formamidopyrimidine-DNA glycosylase
VPELPEVETVVRDLRPLAVGRNIVAVRHGKRKLRTPWNAKWNAKLTGARIEAIWRRGKWIVVDLGTPRLLVHLGMTGQFTVVPATEPETNHVHLVFALHDGNELRFRDIRRFGSATLYPDAVAVEKFFVTNELGPEPFNIDTDYFRAAVRQSARNLKALLLDQTLLAGVGNIYADEACFRAKLNPRRLGRSLTFAEADRLREAIETVLTRAIEGRGSTIRDYVGGSGLRGAFQNEHAVYGRTGEACVVCETAIECVRLAGRSSHFCPRCQKKTHHEDSTSTKKKNMN